MLGAQLRVALRSGQRVYGTLVVAPSPRWPKVLRDAGLDFVFIDTEHMALGRETVAWMCQTYRAMNLAPIVRIPSPDPYQAAMALDSGASGVIAPYIESASQVRALVGATKLRPLKGQRLHDVLWSGGTLPYELQTYLDEYNADSVFVANIESQAAIDALDDILAVPGLDAVLIGPHDLTCSLGIPEQYTHPEFVEKVSQILYRARQARVGAGIHYSYGIGQEIAWVRAGANLVVHSSDVELFAAALRSDLQAIRQGTDVSCAGDVPRTEHQESQRRE